MALFVRLLMRFQSYKNAGTFSNIYYTYPITIRISINILAWIMIFCERQCFPPRPGHSSVCPNAIILNYFSLRNIHVPEDQNSWWTCIKLIICSLFAARSFETRVEQFISRPAIIWPTNICLIIILFALNSIRTGLINKSPNQAAADEQAASRHVHESDYCIDFRSVRFQHFKLRQILIDRVKCFTPRTWWHLTDERGMLHRRNNKLYSFWHSTEHCWLWEGRW